MKDFSCSHCNLVCFNCTNYNQKLKWVQLTCQNCAINGNLKQNSKKNFNLIEQEVLQKVIDEKIKITNQLREYKKQYYRKADSVFDTLINKETYKFTQDFVAFKENITKEEASLQKAVKECQERILSQAENLIKRCIIQQVKELNKGLQNGVDVTRKNVEKVYNLRKKARQDITSLLEISLRQEENQESKTIFTPPEINAMMSGYDKKINTMESKAHALNKLHQQGEQILTVEGFLKEVPRRRAEERAPKREEMPLQEEQM